MKKQHDPPVETEPSRRFVAPSAPGPDARNDARNDARTGAAAPARFAEPMSGDAGDSPGNSPWIREALRDLDESDRMVEEDGLPEIETETKTKVANLLRVIARRGVGTAPIVYPTESGGVAVYFHSRPAARAILIEVGNGGRGSFVYVTDEHEDRCACDCDAAVLPRHPLLLRCLDELGPGR